MNDVVELRGLRLLAVVGALPEEHDRAQPIEVDVDIAADLAPAGASDRLEDTVDYGAVCEVIEDIVVGGGHVALLETVADRIATRLLGLDARIDHVTVAVRKLRPPVPQDLATSGVRITRRR